MEHPVVELDLNSTFPAGLRVIQKLLIAHFQLNFVYHALKWALRFLVLFYFILFYFQCLYINCSFSEEDSSP